MSHIIIRNKRDNSNRTPEIVEVLRTIPDDSVIEFEQGTYDFHLDGAYVEYLTPVCNQSSDKSVIFPIFRKKNICIKGNGSRFIFHDRVFPFAAYRTEGITFTDFSVDFSFPRYCTANAVCSDEGIFLELDKKEHGCSVNEDGNLIFNAGKTIFNTREKVFFMQQGESVCFLAAGKLSYDPINKPADVLFCNAEETEDGIFLRYSDEKTRPFSDGTIVINYDEARENDIIFCDRCSDVNVKNIKIYSGAGMGIVTQLCHNVNIENISIQPGINNDKIYSTTSDGLFFTQDSGRVLIRGCDIRNTMDDAVSIHNIYAKVTEILTDNKVRVKYQHVSHSGFNPFISGETVHIYDSETRDFKGEMEVVSSHTENDTYYVLVEFSEPVNNIIKTGDYLENHAHSPEVLIEDCTFENIPHIRLGSAGKIIFRQNLVLNSDGVRINDLMQFWYAYGLSDDVYLTGNRFINCSTAVTALVDRGEKCTMKHGRVRLQKNQFMDCDTAISLSGVREPVLTDNSCIRVNKREVVDNCGEIRRDGICQLLMRRDTPSSFVRTPLPAGYKTFTFHRGGDERMSMDEYISKWFEVTPHWNIDEFWFFYNDDRIPEDGHFLILDESGNAAAHSNIQLNEHKPGSATVHFVEVRPDERGKRLGYSVSELVLDYVEKHNIPVTYLTTDEFRVPAIKIYLKLGFRPVLWDKDMAERWAPIMRSLGYEDLYDFDENPIKLTDLDKKLYE